jgi:hypothetical protein
MGALYKRGLRRCSRDLAFMRDRSWPDRAGRGSAAGDEIADTEVRDELIQGYATGAVRGLCYGMRDMPSASMRGLARRQQRD